MERAHKISLLVGLMLLGLFMLGTTNALSVEASQASFSFGAVNATVGLNQNLFFNLSANSRQDTNYVILLNNGQVLSGVISPNQSNYIYVKYNITNTPFGNYKPTIKFSTGSSQILLNTTTTILPTATFSFVGYSNYTSFFNNSARLTINVYDSGNTPLNFTWGLPSVNGIAFSLLFKQDFSLKPSQTFKIPMNMTLSSPFSRQLNFSFVATFQNTNIRKSYITELFSPVINMSFFDNSVQSGSGNTSNYTVQIHNGNNVAVNTTFQFLLDIEGNLLYYNKSEIISPNTKNVTISIPKGTVVSVGVFYKSQNGTSATEQIFNQPVSTPFDLGAVLSDIAYIGILGVAVIVLILLHLRFEKRGGAK